IHSVGISVLPCFRVMQCGSGDPTNGRLRSKPTPVDWPRMPSLLTPADRDAILGRLRRLRRLQPDQPARWGRFTAPAMVCHLADQLRVALGDLSTRRHDNLASRTILKWIVVYSPM